MEPQSPRFRGREAGQPAHCSKMSFRRSRRDSGGREADVQFNAFPRWSRSRRDSGGREAVGGGKHRGGSPLPPQSPRFRGREAVTPVSPYARLCPAAVAAIPGGVRRLQLDLLYFERSCRSRRDSGGREAAPKTIMRKLSSCDAPQSPRFRGA